MDINKYQLHKDFDRNEAIFILHTIDKTPLEEISLNFNLTIEELTRIISKHEIYATAVEGSNT